MYQLRPALTPKRAWHAWHAWLLAVLLLAAQAAGLAHRVTHPQTGNWAQAATAQQQQRIGADHQQGSADCRLIDHLMHADALCSGAVVTTALPRPAVAEVALPAEAARVAAAALYLARAPPLQA